MSVKGDSPSAHGPDSGELASPTEVKTAGVRMIPIDGKFSVWTKRVGAGPVKMLTLHGGPGASHEYFECFEDFLPAAGIEFYYYDQLGSAYSDQPEDTSLWTVPRFREEVEQVRAALGLEGFYLYGQSWGGMLGIEYALEYQHRLKALVISNMTASIPSYAAYIGSLRAKLPPEVIAVLDRYEQAGDYKAAEYEEAMFNVVYAKHMCRLNPWPEPVMRMLRHFSYGPYNTLQGPNEFVITGTFKDWDRWADLSRITVPTLLIGAAHDSMNPNDIVKMGAAIPNSRVVICERGSHLAMWDDQETYFRELLRFVADVESGRFPGTA